MKMDKGCCGGKGMKGGEVPNKVNVPLPGTNTTQPAYKGGMKKAVTGFSGGGEKPAKV